MSCWYNKIDIHRRWNSKIDSVSHYNIPITVSFDGTTSNIRHIHLNESILYLRHISHPDGDQTDTFHILIRKADTFFGRLISSAITRSQVTMANNSIINPTLKYHLAITSFTNEMIDTLHKSIHPTVIYGMGNSSRRPKELHYGLHHHCSLKLSYYGLE